MRERFQPAKSKKDIYQEAYNASKEGGESFYPYSLVKDAIMALLVVGGIIAMALLVPPSLEPPADPTSTTYNPRPEWYFLFFFQLLKLFPGSMEALAAIVIPLIVLILLTILPFLDRGMDRRWSRRKRMITVGVLAALLFMALEVVGAASAPAQPAGEESREVQMGREVYQEINCAYCHTVNGVGGDLGPDLSGVGGTLEPEKIEKYLENPHVMVPATLHPKLLFTEEEMSALVSYLTTLGAEIEYTAAAPGLFSANCASCHMVGGQGGTLGPDLSAVGGHRSVNFLAAFTADPKTVLPGATMPAYKDVMTKDEINDVAAFLASQKGGSEDPDTGDAPDTGAEPDSGTPDATAALFKTNCASCHIFDGQGGTLGPDLSDIGQNRPIEFLAAFTTDPKSVQADATMPAYGGILTTDQIDAIADYLANPPAGTSGTVVIPDTGTATGPEIPHNLAYRKNCLTCHDIGGFRPFPDNHIGRNYEICQSCHQPAPNRYR